MTYEFADLVDLKEIQSLMQAFCDLTGLPSTIIDTKGNILTTQDGQMVGAGWLALCTNFHRCNPVTAERCRTSDVEISQSVRKGGGPIHYRCLNGLVDAAIPLVIDGDHLANLFTGQFFLEPPDKAFFQEQAKLFGADSVAYMQALEEIPVFSHEFVNKGLVFLDRLATIIAEMGKRQKAARQAEAAARAAHEAVEIASRTRSRFFASASHDLRQPLQALRLFMDILSARLADTEHDVVVRHACQAMSSAEEILNALFDIARIEAGVVAAAPRAVPLGEIFDGLTREFSPQAAVKGLRLRCCPTTRAVRTDPMMLERILRNLLANSVRYTDHGGILIGCRRRHDATVIEVRDTGQGIAPEHLAYIWEEFYQVGNAARDSSEGLGLGLSIARKLADALGHRIEVASRLGAGTCFRVVIADPR